MALSGKKKAAIAAAIVLPIALLLASTQVCLSTYLRHGLIVPDCPDGAIRQTVQLEAVELRRGAEGLVRVSARAHYTAGPSDWAKVAPVRRLEASLFLLVDGKETALSPSEGWRSEGAGLSATIRLPELSDGDYLLRAKVKSPLGETTQDLPLPLYSAARIHVLTDRPLFEQGNTVMFRAVVLRARDLAPLDGRPGFWWVEDANGEVLLEERAPAGEWGVVTGTFPLDPGAAIGTWRVRWVSGGASGETSFRVAPFTLPRFRIELSTDQPFFGPHQRPTLRGAVVYSSGAPVANAAVELDWIVLGDWPAPAAWMEGALPQKATALANGRFTLQLPAVPDDLQGQTTLFARVSAVDPTGDRVESTTRVLLSEDPIEVVAVTELADGLADGFNNRLYLRASTADGRVLEGAHLTVARAWKPNDPGVNAAADEDGVASFQFDPGPPSTVVIAPPPFRPPPKQKVVELQDASDLITDEELPLADQVAIEGWERALEPCAQWATEEQEHVLIGLRIGATGQVRAAAPPATRLGDCVAKTLSQRVLPRGKERLYAVQLQFDASGLPGLEVSLQGVPEVPDGLEERLEHAVLGLRDCIPATVPSASLPRMLEWRTRAGSKEVLLGWLDSPLGERFPAEPLRCMQSRLTRLTLTEPSEHDALGLAQIAVVAPEKYEAIRPQATTVLGYELIVTARRGDAVIGSTRLRMPPGTVPTVRLRATPILALPGATVEVDFLRGPDFQGELPDKLHLSGRTTLEAPVDPERRSARFELPADAEGWYQASWGGSSARVFVRPPAQLSVSVTPERERYAPRELARLAIMTTAGGKGVPAAVGLFGVDESLGQLVTLPGPEAMAGLRPRVTGATPFGDLDAQALTMGRVRGANAAAAIVLGVQKIPLAEEVEPSVRSEAAGGFDPVVELTEGFHTILAELHAQVRAWEAGAPAEEKMTPPKMAALWEKSLEACAGRGEPIKDAFDRRLTLSRLPPDLLALTDPRAVILEGVRLPEDVENWSRWVAEESR